MSETLTNVVLTVPDISCGHCESTVTKAAGALAGVQRVDPSADTKKVEIEFDANQVTLEQIAAALDEAGYPVQS